MRTIHYFWLGAVLIGAILVFYPRLNRLSDEANYIATAYKMGATYEISSATHHTVDVLEKGLEHKHLKMPAYLVVLAAWMKVFPSARFAHVPSLLFFLVAVFLLTRFVIARTSRPMAESILCGVALFATPMGLAFANTAMMETFVLFVAALHFLCWFGWRLGDGKLLLFYITAFLGFITKETLILLTVGIVVAHPREFVRLHRDMFRRSKVEAAGQALLMILLVGLAAGFYSDRGHNPSFYVELRHDPSLDMLDTMRSNVVANLQDFANWSHFPHDYLYGYTLATIAAIAVLTVASRNDGAFHMFLALLVMWTLTIALVLLAFYNDQWRSHRLFSPWWLLSTAAAMKWILDRVEKRPLRIGLLCLPVIANLWLCYEVNRYEIYEQRPFPQARHALTQLHLLRPGDYVYSVGDFQWLTENPRCEMIWTFHPTSDETFDVLAKASPRFLIVPAAWDFRALGYRRVATFRQQAKKLANRWGPAWAIWMLPDSGLGMDVPID